MEYNYTTIQDKSQDFFVNTDTGEILYTRPSSRKELVYPNIYKMSVNQLEHNTNLFGFPVQQNPVFLEWVVLADFSGEAIKLLSWLIQTIKYAHISITNLEDYVNYNEMLGRNISLSTVKRAFKELKDKNTAGVFKKGGRDTSKTAYWVHPYLAWRGDLSLQLTAVKSFVSQNFSNDMVSIS